MSQRFQNTLQSPAKTSRDHQGPQQVGAPSREVLMQPWGKFPQDLHMGKGKIPSWNSQFLLLSWTRASIFPLHLWDFHGERKKGSDQSRAPGISHWFPFPSASFIKALDSAVNNQEFSGREGGEDNFSVLFSRCGIGAEPLTHQNLSPACRSFLLA